jgi:integrase
MITDAEIVRALRIGMDTQLSDGNGKGRGRLVLIVRKGRASWYAQQWLAGKKRLKKLGVYPRLTLAEARKRYEADFAQVIETKQDIRVTTSLKEGTLADLFAGYVESLEAAGKRTAKQIRKDMDLILTHIDGRMPARDVRTDYILNVLRPIYARGKAGRADHVRSHVRSAFEWGIRADNDYRSDKPKRFLIEVNPCSAIPPEPKKAGNRYLSVDECRAFWRWLHDTTPFNARAGHGMVESNLMCLRVILLTGQRVEMISWLTRSQYDGDVLTWEKTKTGEQPHLLPVPEQAKPILDARASMNYDYLFPSVFNPTRHVRNEVLQDITARFCARSGVYRFTPRDLRRTWKTLAGFAGVTKVDRDLVQVHSHADISSRHYDRYEYLPEKRAAMKRWSEWFRDEIEKAT